MAREVTDERASPRPAGADVGASAARRHRQIEPGISSNGKRFSHATALVPFSDRKIPGGADWIRKRQPRYRSCPKRNIFDKFSYPAPLPRTGPASHAPLTDHCRNVDCTTSGHFGRAVHPRQTRLRLCLGAREPLLEFVGADNMVSMRQGHAAVRLASGTILFVGGGDLGPSAAAELYDPATGRFAPSGALSIPRDGGAFALTRDGRALAAGGDDAGTCETYDPSAGAFRPTAPMRLPRAGHTATLLGNGCVLIVGGTDASGNAVLPAERFR